MYLLVILCIKLIADFFNTDEYFDRGTKPICYTAFPNDVVSFFGI